MKLKYVEHIKDKLDAGFNASEASEDIIDALDNLCQIMFDPENRPPQYSADDAWQMFLDVVSARAKLESL